MQASSVDGGFRALALGLGSGAGRAGASPAYERALAQFAAHEA